jgi:hypothetical protein
MQPTTDSEDKCAAAAALGGAAPIVADTQERVRTRLTGTIRANVESGDRQHYREGSEMLTRGSPVPQMQCQPAVSPGWEVPRPKPRAKDLLAELNSINSQIHEIMSQVERAVARLATDG